mmetsp:Transcript_18479/g.51369  ORF Transcript_18479/g.51369 Transcript_18479/m.51369 type:complete len:207 (+) Transcript_18479:280-900(+)
MTRQEAPLEHTSMLCQVISLKSEPLPPPPSSIPLFLLSRNFLMLSQSWPSLATATMNPPPPAPQSDAPKIMPSLRSTDTNSRYSRGSTPLSGPAMAHFSFQYADSARPRPSTSPDATASAASREQTCSLLTVSTISSDCLVQRSRTCCNMPFASLGFPVKAKTKRRLMADSVSSEQRMRSTDRSIGTWYGLDLTSLMPGTTPWTWS